MAALESATGAGSHPGDEVGQDGKPLNGVGAGVQDQHRRELEQVEEGLSGEPVPEDERAIR